MSNDSSSYPRRRAGPALLALALAFLAGLALMAGLAARFGWFAPSPPRATLAPGRSVATAPAARAATPMSPPADAAMLQTREAILSAELASLESRTAIVAADADEASTRANHAEAMLVAFAARRAIDRGLGLGAVEAPLVARFAASNARALDAVRRGAREHLTLDDLRGGLDTLSAGLVGGGDDWWASLRHSLRALVVIHPAGIASTVPAERLAHARRLLDMGQAEAAAVEVARLPGAGSAAGWLIAAHRYADVHRALDELEAAALSSESAGARAAVPAR